MPAMPEMLAKPPILKRLDALSLDPAKLKRFRVALETAPKDLATIGYDFGLLLTVDEVAHIRDDWCSTWWPHAQPVEPILRHALMIAIDVAFRDPDATSERATCLPIDAFWECDPGHGTATLETDAPTPDQQVVAATVTWNARQVSLTINTPDPPYTLGSLTGTEAIYVIERAATTGEIVVRRP